MENLRIGIPSKGRLSEIAGDLLKQAGLSFRRQNRSLFARVKDLPIDVTFLRTDDIPVLCQEGAIDMGITGSDIVLESQANLNTRLKLGTGHCRLALCVPNDGDIEDVTQLEKCRIATTFPNITREYLNAKDIDVHFVQLSGSVEIMIQLGVADAIVDLVETGSTLAANNLRILDILGHYETVLIENPNLTNTETANRVVRRLEGVIIAREYSLLEYNIPRSKLKEAEQITPGFNSPTVNSLEDPDWCSVRVMVKQKDVISAMEDVEAIGATAILETKISNCRL